MLVLVRFARLNAPYAIAGYSNSKLKIQNLSFTLL